MYCHVKQILSLAFLMTPYLSNAVEVDEAIVRNYRSISDPKEEFNTGNLQFTANFFNDVVKENPGKSVIISPYSALLSLSQLALYANGETLKQILNATGFNTKDQIRQAIPEILESIDEQRDMNFALAKKVYGNIKNKFSDAFLQDSKTLFKSEAESVDFTDTQAAANIINSWGAKSNMAAICALPVLILYSEHGNEEEAWVNVVTFKY